MQSSVFLVGTEPYCIWDSDLAECSRRFLTGLDPEYFQYSFQAHVDTEDEKRASVALRLGLHHALETFFSLIGALLQAPDCPFAWISKYNTSTLRTVVQQVSQVDKGLHTKLNINEPSWLELSRCINQADPPDPTKRDALIAGFAWLWQRMATEFLSEHHTSEYNSIKHGFRVRSGGFELAIAQQDTPGTQPPPDAFKPLGKSDFGSMFFRVEPLTRTKGDRSLTVAEHSVNWSLERTVLLYQLAYISINNVVSALRSLNGVPPTECKYLWPTDPKEFRRPWDHSTGVTSMVFRRECDPKIARAITRDELIALVGTNGA